MPLKLKDTFKGRLDITACLSGAAILLRRQRGEKNAARPSTVENWRTALRVPSATGARY